DPLRNTSQRTASYHSRGRRGKSRQGGRPCRTGARAARQTPKRDRIAGRFPQGRGTRARDPGGAGMSAQTTRVRGLAPWSPRHETLELLQQVRGVLDEYQAHLPLTIRQVFYRLVGAHGFDKSERAYK